jgi:RNA-binding protein
MEQDGMNDGNRMQDLKPTCWIGKRGITDAMIEEIVRQVKDRKVIKVKWLRHTEVDPQAIADATGTELVEVRGHTLVLRERRR